MRGHSRPTTLHSTRARPAARRRHGLVSEIVDDPSPDALKTKALAVLKVMKADNRQFLTRAEVTEEYNP